MELKFPFQEALEAIASIKTSQEKLEGLCCILAKVKAAIKSLNNKDSENKGFSQYDLSKELWKSREVTVLSMVVNVAFEVGDFLLAVKVVNALMDSEKTDKVSKKTLISVLGQIHLQLGDIQEAERLFEKANQMENRQNLQHILNKGLLAVSCNNYLEAYYFFEDASFIDPSNSPALNNKAICLLYLGKAKDTVRQLTEALSKTSEPTYAEKLTNNLNTARKLESS